MSSSKSKKGLKRKKETDVEKFDQRWNITSSTIPVFAGDVGPLESKTFSVDKSSRTPISLNLEATIVDGSVSLEINRIAIATGDRVESGSVRLQFRVRCFTGSQFVADLSSEEIVLNVGQSYAWHDFITVDELWDRHNSGQPEHILSFETQVTVLGKTPASTDGPISTKLIKLEPDTIFMNDQIESDLLLHTPAGTTIAVHKDIIKESSPAIYLKAQNTSGLRVTEVQLDDLEDDTALALLHFVYTDEIPEGLTLGDTFMLLAAGKEYEMPELMDACYDRLVDLAQIDNERTMMLISDMVAVYGSNECLHQLLEVYKAEHPNPTNSLTDWATENDAEDDVDEDEEDNVEDQDLYLN